jgi:hypothetical protein
MPACYKNCETHMWPRSRPGGSMRAIGTVEYEQCNNCLAVRVKFLTDILREGVWVRVEEERVMAPVFGETPT